MALSALEVLRLKGYAPDTLLDVGANLGDFTRKFLDVFPDCRPTLIEPNPYCISLLTSLPYEIASIAASDKNGTAKIYLTKEWLESTGASLYRENTPFFRDEVVITKDVATARIDDYFTGRKFDFVKIDVQGAELDVLNGGTSIIRQADYVLIEVPVVEYNLNAAPPEMIFEKLTTMGFRCVDLTEFHRMGGVMSGALLQMDFLFERNVARPTQNYQYAKLRDYSHVLEFLRNQKRACEDFSVLDVGAAANPWTAEIVDATFDKNSCAVAKTQFYGDMNRRDDWDQVLQFVASNGKFSYCVCTHTLEDLAYPALTLDMLPRVAESGFISVPSMYLELLRHEGPYRGYIHHRWIFCLRSNKLMLVPKVPFVEYVPIKNEDSWSRQLDRMELQIFWRKGLRYLILNDDYLGPDVGTVKEMYSEILHTQSS
jgi:FkbM family methyltransferase